METSKTAELLVSLLKRKRGTYMDCLGRTKTSNFRHRCSRPARILFCWQHMWEPIVVIGALVAFLSGLAQCSGFSVRDLVMGTPKPPSPNVKVFFSEFYTSKPKSDMELGRGQRTLLFVWIPRLAKPIDRLVLGAALVRPVNVGSRSMSGAQLTTVYSKELWNPNLSILDRETVVSLVGKHDFDFHIQKNGDDWISTRTLPRLDPMTSAPCPVFFVLQVHSSTPSGEMNFNAKGDMEIRVTGPDWDGIRHILHVRCIPAESEEKFVTASKEMASTLREDGFRDVPVVLALTAGRTLLAKEGGPTIVEAKVDSLLSLTPN
jgi:hypothetical protein